MKRDVDNWECVASYVATFDSCDWSSEDQESEVGAVDVRVCVGTDGKSWFVRTDDDGGGSDEAPDRAFKSEEAAKKFAEKFASKRHEGGEASCAEDFLDARLEEARGEPNSEGEFCVYWETVGDDAHIVECYDTMEQASAAAAIYQKQLEERHPGRLLCGYSARTVADVTGEEHDGESAYDEPG